MTSVTQWIEIKPHNIVCLAPFIREITVVQGIAVITFGDDTRILLPGSRMPFPPRSEATRVVTPIGDQPLVLAVSDSDAATEWQRLLDVQSRRLPVIA